MFYFGPSGRYNALVIELLSSSLEDLFDICGRRLTVKTVCMVATQLVSSSVMMSFAKLLVCSLFSFAVVRTVKSCQKTHPCKRGIHPRLYV